MKAIVLRYKTKGVNIDTYIVGNGEHNNDVQSSS